MTQARDEAELAEHVRRGHVSAVVLACAHEGGRPVTGVERSQTIAAAKKILTKRWDQSVVTETQVEAASIAWIALATPAELTKVRGTIVPGDQHLAIRMLGARDAVFRVAWTERAFVQPTPAAVRVAQVLIETGAVPKPDTDGYTLALISRLGWFDRSSELGAWRASVIDVLRSEPDLLVDVWRLFEVEGGGEDSLAAHDKYQSEPRSWRYALVQLSDEGLLDRDRLLDASLDALQRGFAPFRAQWFSAFHEALAPTIDERRRRGATYLDLAASPVASTLAMTLKALTTLQKAGALDGAALIDQIEPALLAPSKAAAKLAVRLVANAVAQEPALVGDGARVLVAGLGNPNADTQLLVVTQLRRWSDDPPATIRDAARQAYDGCHPAVRTAIDAWLGIEDAPPSPGSAPAPTTLPPVRTVTFAELADLEHAEPLQVPSDLDDLFERASALLEAPADADEIEAVLTAAARMGRARVDPDPRAATVGRRAAKALRSEQHSERPARGLIALALTAWLAPDRVPAGAIPSASSEVSSPSVASGEPHRLGLPALVIARLVELSFRLRAGDPFEPLASPTHKGGFLDPAVFVQRVVAAPPEPESAELAVALMRVVPDAERLRSAIEELRGADPLGIGRWMGAWADSCAADLASPVTWSHDGYPFLAEPLPEIAIAPSSAVLELVTVSGAYQQGRFHDDAAGVSLAGSLLPGRPGSWARLGARAIGPTAGPGYVAHGDPIYLERFFDPHVPLTDAAHLLLALALSDPRPVIYPLAVDLAVAAIDDGRFDPQELGRHIGALVGTSAVTPQRWGRSLGALASVGPLHQAATRAAIEAALAGARRERPQDLLALVELLEVILLETGDALASPQVREVLAGFRGSGKAAKTAARILALEPA